MDRAQFVVLYREFLFRMVDPDLLSVQAQGDVSKLLGRFAAILVWISIPFGGMALGAAHGAAIAPVHSVIATTMLLVSVFCVLAWDSLLPDRRDIFVLLPLGVSAATILAARAAALFAALGVAVLVFNAIPGVLFPFALTSGGLNLLEIVFSFHMYRAFAAYWITMFLSGGFVVLSIVLVQAVLSQLPRWLALRLSSILQIATFCTAIGVYFLQPFFSSAGQLTVPENQQKALWLPSYWFLGLFHQLKGLEDGPGRAALTGLAREAWLALAIVGAGAAISILFACAGALRKIAEQPDAVPGRRRHGWPWNPCRSTGAAIVQWTMRTLLRSRQHRVLVSFYAGIGFAAIILFLQTPRAQVMSRTPGIGSGQDLSLPLIGVSFVMMISWIVGVRAAFAIPVEVRANWIFRVTLNYGAAEPLAGTTAALFAAGLLPVWCAAATAFVWLWPLPKAGQHLLVLGVAGTALTALCLRGFRKIPFTCTYLPGTSHIHITMACCVLLGLNALFWSAKFERQALFDPILYLEMTGVMVAAAAVCWWSVRASRVGSTLDFEEQDTRAVITLGLGALRSH
jgi:hypothetical protein